MDPHAREAPSAVELDAAASPRSRVLRWLKPALTIALYALVFRFVDVGGIVERLRAARFEYVALAALLYAAGQALSAWRWRLLLRPVGLDARYSRMVGFYFVGMFFNLFLPTIVGGDAVKAVLLTRDTGAPARSTMSVFMERDVGLLALLVIAAVASWWVHDVTLFGLPLTVLTLLMAAAFVVVNVLIAHRGSYALADRLIAATPLARLRPRVASLYDALALYLATPGQLLAPIALSFIFQLVVIGVVFLNALALDHQYPLTVFAVFVPLISLAGMVPISVNGLGVREALYVLLFGRIGMPADLAVSLALLFLAVTFVTALPGGLVYTLQRAPARAMRSRTAGSR